MKKCVLLLIPFLKKLLDHCMLIQKLSKCIDIIIMAGPEFPKCPGYEPPSFLSFFLK